MWCEKTKVETHCHTMFFNVECEWDLKYDEHKKLSTFHVNFQNDEDFDKLIY